MIENKIDTEISVDLCPINFNDENSDLYMVSFQGNIEEDIKKNDYACLTYITNRIAYILVKKGRIQDLLNNTPTIIRVIKGQLYSLLQLSPIEAGGITKINTNPILNLKGSGVIVGMIDTGIDYLNKEFQYEDNTTRIINIWDQTINQGKIPENFFYGSEYERSEINSAIKLEESKGDPKTIVPSVDTIGHGTASAGIIGARGINKEVQSAVPECEFIIVKLKEASDYIVDSWGIERRNRYIYTDIDIILAIDYIVGKINKILKPVVIFIPLGTNTGSHDSSDTLDVIIDNYSLKRGTIFATGLGNEGSSETHASGKFVKSSEVISVELKIDKNQKNIFVQIWVKKPDKVSIEIISPSGETSEIITAKVEGFSAFDFVYEGSNANVRYKIPDEDSGDELIEVEISKLVQGIWLIKLHGDYILDGRFDAWLLQRELLERDTKFLKPDPYITLTRPSTSNLIITCGYYNQIDNSLVADSSRGYTRDGRIKPDLACGGVNVLTTAVGGGTTTVTGSSIAAAVLAGAIALLLQWGIVDGRDPTMFAIKIKNYLIRGSRKRSGDKYPNPELGYGLLDMVEVFNQIRPSVRSKEWEKDMLIKIPSEIKDLLSGK